MLADETTYIIINRNPIYKIESILKDILTRWMSKSFIDEQTKKSLITSDALLHKAYEVPKTHKLNCPFRIIISTINSPLHKLAIYMHKILYKSIPNSPFSIKNSFHLYNKVSGIQIDKQYILCLLDVTSLFTNVPIELMIQPIVNRWRFIKLNTKITQCEFIWALQFVMESTFLHLIVKFTNKPMEHPWDPLCLQLWLILHYKT